MTFLFFLLTVFFSSLVTLLIVTFTDKRRAPDPANVDPFAPTAEDHFNEGAQFLGGRIIARAMAKDEMFFSKSDIIKMVNTNNVIAERGQFVITPDDQIIFSPLKNFPNGYLLYN